jgi:hypothetical protein
VWYRDKKCQAGFVVVKGKKECLMSYRTAKTLGIINMDENHVVGSVNKPEKPQRIKENKVKNITKTFPPPKNEWQVLKGRAKSDVPVFVQWYSGMPREC